MLTIAPLLRYYQSAKTQLKPTCSVNASHMIPFFFLSFAEIMHQLVLSKVLSVCLEHNEITESMTTPLP